MRNADELARCGGLRALGGLIQRWLDTPTARALLAAGARWGSQHAHGGPEAAGSSASGDAAQPAVGAQHDQQQHSQQQLALMPMGHPASAHAAPLLPITGPAAHAERK